MSGLIEGFGALAARGELRHDLVLLRSGPTEPDLAFPAAPYPRRAKREAAYMHLENLWRLDSALPPGTDLFHATSMDGVARRTPWVATCHDLIPLVLRGPYLLPWELSAQWFWRRYARVLRSGPRRVIAISEHVRRTLVDRFGIPEDRVDVVVHGVSSFWFGPDTQTPPSAPSEPFVLFVGGFDARKNFLGLLHALTRIPARHRPRLLVAGVRSPYDRKVHARALDALGPLDVTFLEYVPDTDLRWLYRHAVALAFPSVEEGWGFPIVEAMAAGAPVVCAARGSMAEAAGSAGVFAEPTDVDALACALSSLIASPALRAERSASGRAHAATFTWERTAREVQAVYERALA